MAAATSPEAATWRNFAPSSIIRVSTPRATTWTMVRAPTVQSARMRSIRARPRAGLGIGPDASVPYRIRWLTRSGCAAAYMSAGGPLGAQRIDHRLEVRDPLGRRDVAHLAIGEARTAPVEAHDAAPAAAREPIEK